MTDPRHGIERVAELREALQRHRAEAQALHAGGASGPQVCWRITEGCDRIVRSAFDRALDRLGAGRRSAVERNLSLVAVGGYGRGDLAPYSDVDLLFLVRPRAGDPVREFVAGLVRDLWDIGLKLSQSVRTPAECAAFAARDLPARTALLERRRLTGETSLTEELSWCLRGLVGRRAVRRLLAEILAERRKEQEEYDGETVCLLEPNLKTSAGGLRDLHVLRWMAAARHGTADLDSPAAGGILSDADAATVRKTSAFLKRLRNELHFRAGSAQDVLTREEQVRLAAWLGYEDEGGLLGVERFMQHYYRMTTALHDVMTRFVDRLREPSWLRRTSSRLLSQRAGEQIAYRVDRVVLDRTATAASLGLAESLLEVFEAARGFGVSVDHASLERIRSAVPTCRVTAESRARFLSALARPAGLGWFLRSLHRVGLLERLLPPLAHTRCLIQFNRLHRYTVDEHSIRAVEAATYLLDGEELLSRVYRSIRRKDLLHLALLLHDAGKGYGEDHSEAGLRLAEQTAAAFALDSHERDLLLFLVHRHLLMAHTAFRRDVSDVRTLVSFARAVGTPEALRMLFVLTAADTKAVAPGEWTAWKESLLSDLYSRAMRELTGPMAPAEEPSRLEALAARRRSELRGAFPEAWLGVQLAAMPPEYLEQASSVRLACDLQALRRLSPGGVEVVSEYLSEMQLMRYTVFAHDGIVPGLFSRIAGVLAANGFQIIDAQIVTRSDGVIMDTFVGTDTDFAGEPPLWRREEISSQLRDVLRGRQDVEALLSRRGGSRARTEHRLTIEPSRVAIDNESSDRFTIVDVFAADRLGLLHAITKALFEEGLSVHSAKVSTHYDQVVDVFYVTDAAGEKVCEERRLESIRQRILASL